MDTDKLLSLTAEIVSGHASTNELTQEALVEEIGQVFVKLASLAGIEGVQHRIEETAPEPETTTPAVPLEAAFGVDKVFCMVCGLGMKTLKRHLATAHDLKPGQYRRRFGIPAGRALVAKNYSEQRKAMAKKLDLGEKLVQARAVRAAKKAPAKAAKRSRKKA